MLENIKYCTGNQYHNQTFLKKSLAQMWKNIFGDSDEYIELYFRDKYRPAHVFCACAGEKIVSCFYSDYYKFNVFGEHIDIFYWSAGSTLQEYEGQKIITKLLAYGYKDLAAKGITLVVLSTYREELLPFLKKKGFGTVVKNSSKVYYPTQTEVNIESFEIDEFYNFYKKHIESEQFKAFLSTDDLSTLFEYLTIFNGTPFVSRNSYGEITGVAFVAKPQDDVIVIEPVFNDDIAKENLINQVCSKYEVDSLTITSGSTEGSILNYGMARVLNLQKLLEICTKKFNTLNLTISVSDAIIEHNSGTYTLHNGTCIFNKGVSNPITIDKVLPLLFSEIESQCGVKITPSISLMLE